MAYITKHPKSRFYSAVFRDGTGRQIRRSTKIEAHPEGGDGRERARLTLEAKRKATKIAETFERAARGELSRETAIRKTLLELIETVGGPRIEEKTAADFLHTWLENAEKAGKSETTLKRYRQLARDFLEHLGDRARVPVGHVTSADVQSFLHTLTKRGLATKSISNSLKILRIPFSEGCRLGELSFNPAGAVKPPTVVSVERSAFTPAEITSLLAACKGFENGDQWRTAVMLGYFAGMRLGDATGLKWGNVDFERGMLSFSPEKTRTRGRKLEIPMHPALEKHLHSLPVADDPEAYLTPGLLLAAGVRARLSKKFANLLARAGIDNPQVRSSEGGRAVSTKSFHALRHSLASHLAAAGVSPELRMKITGHTDARTHAGYTHLEVEALREALGKIATS